MRPEARDAAYLWDMLDAARAIAGVTASCHPLLRLALSRASDTL